MGETKDETSQSLKETDDLHRNSFCVTRLLSQDQMIHIQCGAVYSLSSYQEIISSMSQRKVYVTLKITNDQSMVTKEREQSEKKLSSIKWSLSTYEINYIGILSLLLFCFTIN